MKEQNNLEIERKYIIKKPDLLALSLCEKYTVSEILQIYMPSEAGETRRVRRRVYKDKTVCTETKKIRIDNMSSTEIEREIPEDEFEELSHSIKEGTSPIIKSRHTFIFGGQLFEIDIYPQWQSTAIMETELETREKSVLMPDFIELIREVTGEKSYSNAAMSREFPKEII